MQIRPLYDRIIVKRIDPLRPTAALRWRAVKAHVAGDINCASMGFRLILG